MTSIDSTPSLKCCSRCKRLLPPKHPYFNRTKNKKSGLEYHCRGCRYGWTDDEFQADILRHALLERGYKACRDCGIVKPFSDYMKSSSCVGGCRPECRECAQQFAKTYSKREDVQARAHDYNHREDVKQKRREFESKPESKAKKSEYDKSPERRAIKNEYQRRDDVKARKREYFQQPEVKLQMKVVHAKRRDRENQNGKSFTANDWKLALAYFDGCCAVCGCKPKGGRTIAADHWIPLSKGGSTSRENIIPLCHSLKGDIDGCNNTKNAKLPEKWLIERYGETQGRSILARIQSYFEWIKTQE